MIELLCMFATQSDEHTQVNYYALEHNITYFTTIKSNIYLLIQLYK